MHGCALVLCFSVAHLLQCTKGGRYFFVYLKVKSNIFVRVTTLFGTNLTFSNICFQEAVIYI